MSLRKNKRAVSSEVFKIAVGVLIGFAIFAMLATFAMGPKGAEEELHYMGETILGRVQNASLEILAYNAT